MNKYPQNYSIFISETVFTHTEEKFRW